MTLLLLAGVAFATDWYVDPVNGSDAGDGSQAAPWGTLEAVVAAHAFTTLQWDALPYVEGVSVLVPGDRGAVQPGDTVWLLSGHHGNLELVEAYLDAPITLAALPGHTPTLGHVLVRSSSQWVLKGLTVSPSFETPYGSSTMIDIDDHSWTGPSEAIVVEDCTLFSVEDSSPWTADDWNALARNAITVDGDGSVVRGNRMTNVNFGVQVTGTDVLVEHNVVENFAGDGLRGLGDRGIFQYNLVKNVYDVNDNHDDGFQSWSVGADGQVGTGEVVGITLRGNTFLNFEDPNQPLLGPLQGIGCFDGMFRDWVIENNVVVVDHWHGISLYGMQGGRIVNNTVIDIDGATGVGPSWIKVTAHKDGTPSDGVVIRNNLVDSLALDGTNLVEDHNLVGEDPTLHLVDWPRDLHLLAASTAIDAGSPDLAPSLDRDGLPRPAGGAVDIGAYEFGAVAPPVDSADTASHTGTPATGTADTGTAPGTVLPTGSTLGPTTSPGSTSTPSDTLLSTPTAATPDEAARGKGCGCGAVPPGGAGGLVALLALAVSCRRRCLEVTPVRRARPRWIPPLA